MIVILGSNGMLGSMMSFVASKRGMPHVGLGRDRFDALTSPIDSLLSYKPTCIVNCIGAIPQKHYDEDMLFRLNRDFPNTLTAFCQEKDIPLIHMSTNCVFSGESPCCTETEVPNAKDIYGISKAQGEPDYGVVIRSSIIGPEKEGAHGLFEWFLQSKSDVNGYTDHMWNGVTTYELSQFVFDLLNQKEWSSRILHVYSEDTVSKYELLCLIKGIFHWSHEIHPIQKGTKYYTLLSNVTSARCSLLEQLQVLKDIYPQYNAYMSNIKNT
jgi:dTDP-4-dehydrorhamnose reductase